jgi:hypothetical protein
MQPSDVSLHEAKEQLLTTALGDVKGSIHANDQKVSAALVVNGLLLTSVVTVVTHTDRTYKMDELTAEVLKLADILHMESDCAKKGYEWLVLEGGAVILFFVLVASVAV